MKKRKLKTNVYVDGFNLYYGALKGTPYKWLDLDKLFKNRYPHNDIEKIKYFTARVHARDDPGKRTRQAFYWRALRTFSHIEIIEGNFQTNKVRMSLVSPPPNTAEVWKTEEKGSDVNLAVHLLNDAHKEDYEVAIVVSNDSDLGEAIRIVTRELRLRVGIIFPGIRPSTTLRKYATFLGPITKSYLSRSLLPDTLEDASGEFHKPPTW